jgi:hypothetical protein
MCCAWCGENDASKIKHFSAVPERYNKYDFCITGTDAYESCFSKYGSFIYSYEFSHNSEQGQQTWGVTALKHGLPYCVTKKHPDSIPDPMLRCDYCGQTSSSVIDNVCMPEAYTHRKFCKNDTCCYTYCEYVYAIRNTPKVPFAFNVE